ncbi:MAG: 2-amino-4-hydroxy-6-hydroxymethyldihydropteridine diphosphokinase [Dehalococcoidia bacterium]
MTTVLIALGSNLGDRLANLRAAVALLPDHGVLVTRTSSVWETAPVPADQPPFLNAALRAETELVPAELLAALKSIEHALGRRPSRRWGPRPIDLDILFYGDDRLSTPDLTIPHPLVADRAFVLAPLAEVWPDRLPLLGASAVELLARMDQSGLSRTGQSV